MTRDVALLVAHALAVAGAALALAVLLPHPELGAFLPGPVQALLADAGPVPIVLGALAMASFGGRAIGVRRTLAFFGVAVALSLGTELLAAGADGPLGAYGYTSGLGAKVLGRVPWPVPLATSTLGFASYLLATAVLGRFVDRPPGWAVVGLGTWLLVAADLVLDPALSHPDLPQQLRVWHVHGGGWLAMPLANLAARVGGGAATLALARALGGPGPLPSAIDRRYVFAIYVVDVMFGVALCAGVGLWQPIVLVALAGLVPAALVGAERTDDDPSRLPGSLGAAK